MSNSKKLFHLVSTMSLAVAVACGETSGPSSRNLSATESSAALKAVVAGNQQAIKTAPALVPAGAPLAPFVEARLYAITNLAMHDAMNAIMPRYERFADVGDVSANANVAAAILTAAHDAILAANKSSKAETDTWYAASLKAEESNPGFLEGVLIGHRVAAAVIAARANDGTDGGGVAPYTPGSGPGDYRFTVPFNTPAFDFFGTGGFADASKWGALVKTFALANTQQFRAPAPYGARSNITAVSTDEYTDDFEEVKALGCKGCAARTSDQTEIGLFWLENSPAAWNRVGLIVADSSRLDAWDTGRLMALLQMGEFDAYATNLESKYHYNFWRPVTAIAMADVDDNPRTVKGEGWQELGFPTPPVPDYPSAHAAAGSVAATIIDLVVARKPNSFRLTSESLPGVSRSFATVAAAARENALSRIYVGFHFRRAVNAGQDQGGAIGDYIARNSLHAVKK